MLREIDWSTFPGRDAALNDDMKNFYETGANPGKYLKNILMKDPRHAMDTEDDGLIYEWLYKNMPAIAFGSISRYEMWLKKGGMHGFLETHRQRQGSASSQSRA